MESSNNKILRTRWLLSIRGILSVWLLAGLISSIHYLAPVHTHWIHDVLRRAYYLPIVIAAVRSGLAGGIITAFIITILYIPHGFIMMHHLDPTDTLEKILEIVLYFSVAAVSGILSDRSYKQQIRLEEAIEEQKNLSESLIRAGKLASLGEVVAGIAHEIKNPLHALAGTAEILDDEISDTGNAKKMWKIHKQEIERLKTVSNKFLSFAKSENSEIQKINLNTILDRLTELIAADARQKNILIVKNLSNKPVFVMSDENQLIQVALNIAVNAIREMEKSPHKETLLFSTGIENKKRGRNSFFKIENSGSHIDEQIKDKIFDPFFTQNGGTGLGLSISSKIISDLGGVIDVLNSKKGVSFTVKLPSA